MRASSFLSSKYHWATSNLHVGGQGNCRSPPCIVATFDGDRRLVRRLNGATPYLPPPPSTDMHHIFEVDEILRIITSSLGYGEFEDAISLACCRKSFSAPALDAIWGTYQREFTWLLRTLPPSVWMIVDKTFVRFLFKGFFRYIWLTSSAAGLCP